MTEVFDRVSDHRGQTGPTSMRCYGSDDPIAKLPELAGGHSKCRRK